MLSELQKFKEALSIRTEFSLQLCRYPTEKHTKLKTSKQKQNPKNIH